MKPSVFYICSKSYERLKHVPACTGWRQDRSLNPSQGNGKYCYTICNRSQQHWITQCVWGSCADWGVSIIHLALLSLCYRWLTLANVIYCTVSVRAVEVYRRELDRKRRQKKRKKTKESNDQTQHRRQTWLICLWKTVVCKTRRHFPFSIQVKEHKKRQLAHCWCYTH